MIWKLFSKAVIILGTDHRGISQVSRVLLARYYIHSYIQKMMSFSLTSFMNMSGRLFHLRTMNSNIYFIRLIYDVSSTAEVTCRLVNYGKEITEENKDRCRAKWLCAWL